MLTWWDGSHWTDRRTPIPGGPLDPAAADKPTVDDGELTGAIGDDADRPSENSGPIPVIAGAEIDDSSDAVFSDPTSVFAPVGPEAWSSSPAEPVADYDRRPDDEQKRRPRAWLVLLPLVFIALAAGALIATGGDDDGGDEGTDDSDQLVTIAEAVAVAEEDGLPVDLAGSTVGSLIDDICDSAGDSGSETGLALRIAQLGIEPEQVNPLLNALGKGAAVRCPDAIASDSGLLLRTGELAIESLGPTTTLAPATTEVAAPPVTEVTTAPTTPTAPAATPTTRKPTTATTRAPATTQAPSPPPTIATTTTAACNANYAKCLNRAGDYDCTGQTGDPDFQAGDGPNFTSGPFAVTGGDPYDLDLDGNGVACERA